MSKDKQPEIRFPGFTEDWEQCLLGETLKDLKSGLSRMLSNDDIGLPVVRANNINDGQFDMINDVKYWYENDPQGAKTENYLVHKNDILINFINSEAKMGTATIVQDEPERKTIYTTNILKAQVADNFDADFWFALTQTYRYKIDIKMITKPAVNQASFTTVDFKKLSYPFPAYDEQVKIGSFFKNLDYLITLHQRKLDLLKETKKGFLQKMFPKNGAKVPEIRFPGFTEDWEERRLNDFISGDISDGDWIEKEHIKDEGKYRIIQTGNIGNGVYIDKEKSAKYMDQNSFDILKANEIFPGDLLVSRLAEPAGRTVILPNIEDRMVTAVDVTILRQNENFDAYFLLSQMNTSKILNKVSKNVSGTSHKRISRKNLEKVTIDSTSIEEQNKIGAFFKQLDDTIALHQRKLDLLKETKKGFLQKMFV